MKVFVDCPWWQTPRFVALPRNLLKRLTQPKVNDESTIRPKKLYDRIDDLRFFNDDCRLNFRFDCGDAGIENSEHTSKRPLGI